MPLNRLTRQLSGVMISGLVIINLAACHSTIADHTAGGATIELPPVEANDHGPAPSAEVERDPDVPELPFTDNADPALCGIPQPWSSEAPAYLSGLYDGKLIQPIVFLYDSHLRRSIKAQAPHGAAVQILLAQSNPTLDYFLVKIIGAEPPNEGWAPAPFVVFEPPLPAEKFTMADRED